MLENKRKLRILGLEYNKIRNKAEQVMRASICWKINKYSTNDDLADATTELIKVQHKMANSVFNS